MLKGSIRAGKKQSAKTPDVIIISKKMSSPPEQKKIKTNLQMHKKEKYWKKKRLFWMMGISFVSFSFFSLKGIFFKCLH